MAQHSVQPNHKVSEHGDKVSPKPSFIRHEIEDEEMKAEIYCHYLAPGKSQSPWQCAQKVLKPVKPLAVGYCLSEGTVFVSGQGFVG